MATFNSILVNKGAGKIGDIVLQRWRQKKVVRGYVAHPKASLHPEIQLRQRAKFKKVRNFVTANLESFKILYQLQPLDKSIFNSIMTFFMDITDNSGVVDIAKLKGKYLGTNKVHGQPWYFAISTSGYSLELIWNANTNPINETIPNQPVIGDNTYIQYHSNSLFFDKNLTFLHFVGDSPLSEFGNYSTVLNYEPFASLPVPTDLICLIYWSKIWFDDFDTIGGINNGNAFPQFEPAFINLIP
jgi:hypothetical protein